MKKEVQLPFKSGFYMTPNSLVTQEGYCMPMLGRTRDKYLYVLTAEPVDPDTYLPLDDNIAVMKTDDVKTALDKGGVLYYTVDSVPLIPYHMLINWEKRDYILFAVRVSDLFYKESTNETVVPIERRLHFMEAHFPSKQEEESKPIESIVKILDWQPHDGYVASAPEGLVGPMKDVADSIMMQKKRGAQITGSQVTYDTARGLKIMDAMKKE